MSSHANNAYRTNSRIVLSNPAELTGYIRSLTIWRIMRIA
jgi:hypothetical protein